MASIIYKWSIDEWHELVDSGVLEGKPVELLEGNIVMRWSASPAELSNPLCGLSPEGIEHSYTNQSVSDYLSNLLRGKAHIRDAHPITLDNSEPEPDIAIVQLPTTIAFGDSPLPKAMSDCSSSHRQHHPFPENIYLLIEISNRSLNKRNNAVLGVSPMSDCSKTDLEEKIITYARNGIPEYWVIDLKNKRLVVHGQPQNGIYSQVVEYRSGAIALQAFRDIEIDLSKLLLY